MLDWIMNQLLPDTATFAAQGFDWLIQFNNTVVDKIFANPVVNAFFHITYVIGSVLYLLGVLFSFANWVVDSREGNQSQITDTFKNIIVGFVALNGYITLPILALKYTNYLCDLMCSNLIQFSMSDQIEPDMLEKVSGLFTPSFLVIVYIIIMFVCMCKVFFSNIKRGGILITLIFVGSFHLFSVPRGYTDAFFGWCKQVTGLCITAFVQNFLVVCAILFLSIGGTSDVISLIGSAGLALSAREVPRVLQQFGLDTSMRANVSQAIFALSGITNIMHSFGGGTTSPKPSIGGTGGAGS